MNKVVLLFLIAILWSACSVKENNISDADKEIVESFNAFFDGQLEFTYPDSALKIAQSAYHIVKNTNSWPLFFDVSVHLGDSYYHLSEFDSALVYYQQAFDMATEKHDNPRIAIVNNLMGNTYYMLKEYDKAKTLLFSALKINKQLLLYEYLASDYSALGSVYSDLYKYDSAIHYYQQAASIFDSAGDFTNYAILIGNTAQVYNSIDNYEHAIILNKKALRIFDSLQNNVQICNTTNSLGIGHMNLGNYDSAAYYFDLSYQKALETGDWFSELIARYNTGKVLSLSGNYTEGNKIMHEVNRFCIENEMPDGQMRCLLILGQNSIAQNMKDIATMHFKEGLSLAKEHDYLYFEKEFLNAIIELELDIEGHQDIKEKYEQLKEVTKELDQKDLKERIAELETKYETANKEKALQTSRHQNKLLNMQNNVYIILSVFLVVVICFIVILYRNRLKLIKNKKQLAEEKVEVQKVNLEKAKVEARLKDETIKNQELNLKQKHQELVHNALTRAKSIEFFHKLKDQIIPFQNRFKTRKDQHDFRQIIEQMEAANNLNAMDQFERVFKELHPGYYQNLIREYPDLTGRELQFCAMIRLNMNTKDIAAVTFLAPTSVDTARYRIRKKMHLDSDESLLNELMKH